MFRFIRKFGLGHCDLTTMMWNVSFFLRFLSLNIDDKNKKGIPVIFYIVTMISGGCYFYVYLISMVWFVFWRCLETGDVLAAMLVFSQGAASGIGPAKLIYTMLHVKKVRKIASSSLACDALVEPGSRFSKNLQKRLVSIKKRAIVFWVVMMGNGVVYLIKPFLMPGRHLMDDIFMYYGLEPMHESPNYEIAMSVTILAVLFTCYCVSNVTAFVIINTGYVEAQMLAWSEELLNLWDDVTIQINEESTNISQPNIAHYNHENRRQVAVNKIVQSKLKEIIKGHVRNLDISQQIENVFRGALAIEFMILIVALIAELLGGLEKTYMEVPFSFIPVLMDCLTGQRLADASSAFEHAVFECKWENFDKSNMKLVLLMLQSSQKTMKLSAGGLALLNFSCLMSVVRTIYSAYTTLRSYTTK